MIGRLLFQARQLATTDPVVAYNRSFVRRRILNLPPLTDTTDPSAEIHVLTSENDWLNLIWSLRSFYAQVPTRYALAIHGDPNLPDDAIAELRRQFPDARIIAEPQVRAQVVDSLADYPRCKILRETNTLSIKTFDFAHFLQTDRMILFDSDLLFFSKPEAFLAYLAPEARINVFNRDVASAYAVDIEVIQKQGFDIVPEINSGFGVIHKESMRLDWLEEFLDIPGLSEGHFWRIEQTLFALCGSRFGTELLPDEYRVFLNGSLGSRPYRHYVGAVRDLMYKEGIAKLKGALLSQK